ncbi:NAD kinase 2, chloroplastic isoform X1 [Vigna radiata var. radiata]|uniref:NAD(+) kinase n=1 Tax=Vigna radiata var. radiata TaxID=3916 RepID=A0A1S3U862_VIGRR|nr:NAD kinase 2, chloroplastic isoform X1 [Vigna radiata var. radiata]
MMARTVCTCHMVFSADRITPTVVSVFSGIDNIRLLPFRFQLRRNTHLLTAQLSNSFSNFGFHSHSQCLNSVQSHVPSRLPWMGPFPGDIAEVEAYCRIFRNSESLHSALVDALCNPITVECSVSYEVPSDEKRLLEDKIVSVLGCIVALVNSGRRDLLSGRSSIVTPFRAAEVGAMEDTLPPLALFRSEMKRCCESLHVALENYLVPGDDRNLDVWRKLQRLKNLCYDSGFPRGEDCPCPSLLANWSPVCLYTPIEDMESKESEAAFWTGGQVTEEGLKWLLNKGYKTIIDLREEDVKDSFYQAAVYDAISSGSIELVRIPVKDGTAPTMEQVERFASYVSNCSKRPIYLHSKEGIRRTSAMVSRWKQYITRTTSEFVSNQAVISNVVLSDSTNGSGKMEDSMIAEGSFQEKDTNLLREGATHGSAASFDSCNSLKTNNEKTKSNGGISQLTADSTASSQVTGASGEGSFPSFSSKINPLEAQIPPFDIFSKRDMSTFLGSRKMSKPSYFSYQVKRVECLPESRSFEPKIVGRAKSSNGSASMSNSHSAWTTINGYSEGEMNYRADANISTTVNSDIDNVNTNSQRTGDDKDKARLALRDEDLGLIEGDMCASSTGVVRVQSRKKAEMFLVRTDGYSCTRERVSESSLAFTHPSTQQQMLLWKSTPKTVLVLKKLGDHLMEEAREVASFLYHQEKMNVFVEPDVHDIFASIPGFGFVQTFYSQDTGDLHEKVDFVACLGGDGVILHASNLFRGAVPPVVSFNLGSLGFLTSHNFEDYKQDLQQIIHGNSAQDGVYITLRMRLRCEIFRKGKAAPGKVFDILNEVVVDRGSNPYLSKIECYEHGRLITKVQADGVIVATPTGSTAYSTAAGGSMVHPNVPCMLFTPICPHSLSFRPVILPDSAQLELKIPQDARSNAWVSFDGKRRQQLSRGDSVRISMSQYPLPTVNKFDQTGDWFHSLIRCLNWNERLDQKAL